tara:strand:- start:2344 stop:2652 length:309 start_codon:yes stop_codon:yes gene_type:complete
MLLDATEPLVLPVIKSGALEEMERIGRNVIEYESLTGSVPDRGDWVSWLDFRYTADEQRRDPWGSAYELVVATDSVMIISYGPDRVRTTEDDFKFVTARGRR